MTLAMVVALREEAQAALALGGWRPVHLGGVQAFRRPLGPTSEALLVVTGVGRERAEGAGQALLETVAPEAIVSLGFAGGLQPGLCPGTLALLEGVSVTEEPEGTAARRLWLESAPHLMHRALEAVGVAELPCRRGLGLTTLGVLSSPRQKAQLGRVHGALTVDLESFWLANLCRTQGVSFMGVRAVVDPLEVALPAAVMGLMAPGTRWRRFPLVLARPGELAQLLALRQAMKQAQVALRAFIAAFLDPRAPALQRAKTAGIPTAHRRSSSAPEAIEGQGCPAF